MDERYEKARSARTSDDPVQRKAWHEGFLCWPRHSWPPDTHEEIKDFRGRWRRTLTGVVLEEQVGGPR